MSFRVKLTLSMVALILLAILPVCALLINQLRTEADLFFQHHRDDLLQEHKTRLRDLTEAAAGLTNQYLDRIRTGELTRAEAQDRALGCLRALRYDEGRGYFWVHEFQATEGRAQPLVVMHPTSPVVVGRPIDEFYDFRKLAAILVNDRIVPVGSPEVRAAGLTESQFLVEMNRDCARDGEGFVTYYWTKPLAGGAVTTAGYPKLAFVKLIPEWNWVIGSGLYIDDLETAFRGQKLALQERFSILTRGAIALALVALLATLLLGYLISRGLTASIREIDGYARAVAEGTYPRDIVVRGSDEFRGMRAAFKAMIGAIDERERELRARARELERVNERLDGINQMKNSLLANVSHELRTPLVCIRGYCEMILTGGFGPITAAQRDKLEICLRNSDTLLHLIGELMSFSEEVFQAQSRPEAVELIEVIREAAATVSVKAAEQQVRLELELPESSVIVASHRPHLVRVITNLLVNAIKFSPRQSRVIVRVDAAPAEPRVAVHVSDEGIGIAPAEQERIFDRFYQVDSSSTRKYGGLGLGLALVKEIIEKYDGTVAVQSEPERGTTFTIRVKRWVEATESAPATMQHTGSPLSRG